MYDIELILRSIPRSITAYRAEVAGTSKATGAVRDGNAAGNAGAAATDARHVGGRRRLTVGVDPARVAETTTDASQLVIARSVAGTTAALTTLTSRRRAGCRVAVDRTVD